MISHYGLIMFSGDPAEEHPDEELRGTSPSATFIAAGEEAFCWDALTQWTLHKPLRMWESAEVVARDPSVVQPSTLVDPSEP